MLLSALSVCVTVHKECSKYYRGLPKTDHSYSFFGSRGGACRAAKRRAEVELSGIIVGFGEREREPFFFVQ
jgi:hypothetical protein